MYPCCERWEVEFEGLDSQSKCFFFCKMSVMIQFQACSILWFYIQMCFLLAKSLYHSLTRTKDGNLKSPLKRYTQITSTRTPKGHCNGFTCTAQAGFRYYPSNIFFSPDIFQMPSFILSFFCFPPWPPPLVNNILKLILQLENSGWTFEVLIHETGTCTLLTVSL